MRTKNTITQFSYDLFKIYNNQISESRSNAILELFDIARPIKIGVGYLDPLPV